MWKYAAEDLYNSAGNHRATCPDNMQRQGVSRGLPGLRGTWAYLPQRMRQQMRGMRRGAAESHGDTNRPFLIECNRANGWHDITNNNSNRRKPMAVKIRLRRMGAKKAPFYRIVVADSRYPRDGRFIEEIGYVNPLADPPEIKLDADKARQWLGNGAQPTDTVKDILRKQGVL